MATCKLRKWRMDDAEALSALLNNKKILDNLRDGIPYPYTKKDAEEYIAFALTTDPNKDFAFAITADGVLAGSITLTRQANIHDRTAEMGYYLGEEFWGQGIGTEAVKQVCDYVFENTDIMRIYAEPFARNAASCRILEKSGFVFEGTLRKNAVKNGVVEDMKMYSLIK